jgi:hypothetical protein
MKLSKDKLRYILKEELNVYINSLKSEKLLSEIKETINHNLINESNKPNYSPKLGTTLSQFIDELTDKQLTNVKFVEEDTEGRMVFSTTTLPNNVIVQSLNDDKELPPSKSIDDGTGKTLLYFDKEKGVDTSI